MLPATCIPELISLYTTQAYEYTEIKHASVVTIQASWIVHHGHCILRIRIHYGRLASDPELEPKALHPRVIKERLALPVIIITAIIVLLQVTNITERLTLQVTITIKSLTRPVTIITERLYTRLK
jgi:hypothetical protein